MLKKIASAEVRLGMYIQKFEGSWVDHPFWKARFLLDDERDLLRIRESGVTAIWIDVGKGVDCAAAPAAVAATHSADPPPSAPAAAIRSVVIGCAQEIKRAAQVCAQAKEEVARLFQDARLGKAVDMAVAAEVVEQISSSVLRHPTALISLARLRTADEYTYLHSVSVCALMTAVTRQMGQSAAQVQAAGMAGLLHDVGKLSMPTEVLNKPGRLTDEEFAIMQGHPARGAELLKRWQASQETLDVCLHHHEKMDGSGYPHGLTGESISVLARVGAVCDVYDAVSSNRPYKQAWSPAESIKRMAEWKGHFDPQVFQAFVKTLGIYPIGSLVRLSNEQLAVVVEQHPENLLTPQVRVFFSVRSRTPLPQRVLDLARAPGNERIVRRENPEEWGFRHLERLWQQG